MADDEAGGRTGPPDVAALAVAGIAVISAVTGIVGGVTGGVARVARNNPDVLPSATILVFVAVGLALVASLISRTPLRRTSPSGPANTSATAPQGTEATRPQLPDEPAKRRWPSLVMLAIQATFLLASLIVFGVAAYLVASALSESLATPDRPIVSAKWTPVSGRWVLSGTARASGLRTESQLTIVVFRLVDNGDPAPPSAKPSSASTASPAPWWTPPDHYVYRSGLVYQQTVGADINGNATVTFEVPLPDGYDAMQVIATLGDAMQVVATPGEGYDCPVPQPGTNSVQTQPGTNSVQTLKFACLTLDAPRALPRSTASASPPP